MCWLKNKKDQQYLKYIYIKCQHFSLLQYTSSSYILENTVYNAGLDSYGVHLTNDGSRQKPDGLVRILTVWEERFYDVIGKCQSHNGVGGWPIRKKKSFLNNFFFFL